MPDCRRWSTKGLWQYRLQGTSRCHGLSRKNGRPFAGDVAGALSLLHRLSQPSRVGTVPTPRVEEHLPCRADCHHWDAYPGERRVVMLEQSIDTKTVEEKGDRHRMKLPEASAKADLPILIFPRMH